MNFEEPPSSHRDILINKLIKLLEVYHDSFKSNNDLIVYICDTLLQLNRCEDLSLIDPKSLIASKFFITLYELLSPQRIVFDRDSSKFTWLCIDLLTNVCKNTSARLVLIKSYNFIPCLANLLKDGITSEKKIKTLRLLHILSYGVKIDWQWPCLPVLLTTLANWIEEKQEDIIILSMGILLNLCFKNLPVTYCLFNNVDVKKLIRRCASFKGPILEAHSCKLGIILDFQNSSNIPREHLTKLVFITFESVLSAFSNKDFILLRETVDFFHDSCKKNNLDFYNRYDEHIEKILNAIDEYEVNADIENKEIQCLSELFNFFQILLEIEVIPPSFQKPLLEMALKFINIDSAVVFLTNLVKPIANNDGDLLQMFNIKLKDISLILEENYQLPCIEFYNKIGAVFELLRTLLQYQSCEVEILNHLKIETVRELFSRVLDNEKVFNIDDSVTTPEAVNYYVQGIALVLALGKSNVKWIALQNQLDRNREVHEILAQALYNSPEKTRCLVLEIMPLFSVKMVAQSLIQYPKIYESPSKRPKLMETSGYPVFSRINKIDDVLNSIKENLQQNNLPSTSNIIELYEHKLMAKEHLERVAQNGAAAALEYSTVLQHKIELQNIELNRHHQLLYHSESCLKNAEGAKKEIIELTNELEAQKGKYKVCKSQLKQKEEAVVEYKNHIKELNEKVDELTQQNDKLKSLVNKLESCSAKQEKNLEKKDEIIKKCNVTIENLNIQIKEMEQNLKQKDLELVSKTGELRENLREYRKIKNILDTITKVASQGSIDLGAPPSI